MVLMFVNSFRFMNKPCSTPFPFVEYATAHARYAIDRLNVSVSQKELTRFAPCRSLLRRSTVIFVDAVVGDVAAVAAAAAAAAVVVGRSSRPRPVERIPCRIRCCS